MRFRSFVALVYLSGVGVVFGADKLKLVGPDTVKAGRSAVFKVPIDEAGAKVSWLVEPSTVQWMNARNDVETFIILLDLDTDATVSFASFDKELHSLKTVHVEGSPTPTPDPPPGPTPDPDDGKKPKAAKLAVGIWFDPATRTAQETRVIAETLDAIQTAKKHQMTIVSVNDDVDEQNGFRPILDKLGALPAVTIQDAATGRLLGSLVMPTSSASLQSEIKKFEAKP